MVKKSNIMVWIAPIIVVIVLIGAGYYFFFSGAANTPANDTTKTTTNLAVVSKDATEPTETSVSTSPISPISPISSSEPITAPVTFSEQVFALVEEAETAYNQQQYESALDLINNAIKQEPLNPFAYNTRGNIYAAMNKFDEAKIDYDKAITLDPGLAEPYYNRGRLSRSLQDYESAIADLKKSITLNSADFSYRAYGNIGVIYYELNDYKSALDALTNSISTNYENRADVYYLRGKTYTALEDYNAAIADYQAALERFSRYDQAFQGLGFAYYKIENFEEARRAIGQALEISPDSSIAHYYLGLIELAEGHPDLAQEAFSVASSTSDSLSAADKKVVLSQVSTELERFSQENPEQSQEVEALIALLPPS